MTDSFLCIGTVREWHDDEGWGLIDCPDVDGPLWAHFSVLVMEGYHSLAPGTAVRVAGHAMAVDGYRYAATRVEPFST